MNILRYNDSPSLKKAIDSIADHAHPRVLFVCPGNICRSPAAEGLMNEVLKRHHATNDWTVDSAGTGGYHIGQLPDPRMRAHARRRGIELTHRCRQVREADFDDFDLIIGMDDSNIDRLRELAPTLQDEAKILPMAMFLTNLSRYDHIPDPYYDGAQGFETVLDLLTEATENLYDTVTEN